MRALKPKSPLWLPLLVALICLMGAAPLSARGETQTEVTIGRVLDAYGGDRIEEVRSYRMTGVISARMRGSEARFTRTFMRPDKLFVDLPYPARPEQRYLDGERGWRTEPKSGEVRAVEDHLLKSMILQAARANIPWVLEENRDRISETAGRNIDGRLTVGLELALGPGMTVRYYVDPASDLIILTQAILDTPGLKTFFETAYSDFRKVRGVVFPHREKNFASGFQTGTTAVEAVEINPEDVNRGTFRPRVEK